MDGFVGRVVLPVNHEFNLPNDYDWFSGLYASTATWIPKQETQLYFLSRNASDKAASTTRQALYGRPASARDIYTLGLRVKSSPGQWRGWDYGARAQIQNDVACSGKTPERFDFRSGAACCASVPFHRSE